MSRAGHELMYMWVYRSGEGSARPVVLFEYQPGRGHEHPERFLEHYVGAIMTDGYAAWRMLGGLKHLGCLAHLRRKFDEALKAQKQPTGRAKEALDMIGKAISYAIGQWLYIYRYIDDGGYAIDNNIIEREIRPFATARKAWLFSDSVPGADASAVIYSLMLTCRACDVEPYPS